MDRTRAIEILRGLLEDGQRWLQPDVIEALKTVTAGVPPAEAPSRLPLESAVTPISQITAFVGVFYCPSGLWISDDRKSWLPVEPREPAVAWNRLLSFGGPGLVRPQRADETWLQSFIDALLPSRWRVEPIAQEDTVTITLSKGISLDLPARSEMVRPITLGGARQWDFKRGASVYDFMTLVAQAATAHGFAPEWELQLAGGEVANISTDQQRAAFPTAPTRLRSAEEYVAWADALARAYYRTIGRAVWHSTPFTSFSELEPHEREGWTFWMRNHPGMLRLELALRGFFASGGEEAWVALSVERESLQHQRRSWLQTALLGADIDQIAAPGLDRIWQEAIASYARDQGLHAIQEPPRYAHCPPPTGRAVDPLTRWMNEKSGYEGHLTAMPSPIAGAAPWLVVENPLALGSHDAVRLSPPSGQLAVAKDTQAPQES